MAVLRYETLGEFYEEYDVTRIQPLFWKKVGKTFINIGSMAGTGYVLMYYVQTSSGFFKGKAFVSDKLEKLLPLYNNFTE